MVETYDGRGYVTVTTISEGGSIVRLINCGGTELLMNY